MLFQRLRRNLATKLSVLVMLAVLSVLLALGLYFDIFLRDNFLNETSQRMQHAYQRLAYNLALIEEGLKDGVAFASGDERILASVELINRYQDKAHYNTVLIDEEKKTLAAELLDRVKLSLNSDIALYGQDGDLIAYSSKVPGGYQIGYVSFESGQFQVINRQDGSSDFSVGKLPSHGNISPRHVKTTPADKSEFSPFITYLDSANFSPRFSRFP